MELLDTVKLRTFVAIAREGSFTRAAGQLQLTQPTVSQQLAALEKSIGATLIVRQPRHLRLTEAGTALLPYAERILSLCEEAVQAAREVAAEARRSLRLGVGHTLATYLLPNLLQQLRRRRPEVEVHIQTGNTTDLLTAVADGQVEVALVGSPASHPELEIAPFTEDELVVIVPAGDPWAEREGVTLDDLRRRPLFTRESGSALHASVRHLLGAEHLSSPRVTQLEETEAIKRSVESGLGIALIQRIAIRREVAQGTLRTVPLLDASTRRTYNIARRRNQPLSPAGEALIALLLDGGEIGDWRLETGD